MSEGGRLAQLSAARRRRQAYRAAEQPPSSETHRAAAAIAAATGHSAPDGLLRSESGALELLDNIVDCAVPFALFLRLRFCLCRVKARATARQKPARDGAVCAPPPAAQVCHTCHGLNDLPHEFYAEGAPRPA
eukprot:SAG11_NODE_10015_length_862_cov_1.612058_1_plen_132_part_01